MATQQIPQDGGRESLLGNILEAIATYAAGFFWYAPVTAFLIFNPWWEFETPEQQLGVLSFFVVFSLIYDTTQRIAANIGIEAKFATKTMRLFVDIGASATVLIVAIIMIILMLMKVWTPQGMDLQIIGIACWFALNDLFGNSNVVHTALRRVSEYIRDR